MTSYRDATTVDADMIDAMAARVWIATFGHSAPAEDIAQYVDEAFGPAGTLRRHLADPAYHFRIAFEDGRVVGYCKTGPTFLTDEVPLAGTRQLHQLYVDPAQHGGGVAATLLDWARDEARAQGATALLLTVWEENHRAKRFYEKHGFVHVGDYAFRTGTQVDRDMILRLEL